MILFNNVLVALFSIFLTKDNFQDYPAFSILILYMVENHTILVEIVC